MIFTFITRSWPRASGPQTLAANSNVELDQPVCKHNIYISCLRETSKHNGRFEGVHFTHRVLVVSSGTVRASLLPGLLKYSAFPSPMMPQPPPICPPLTLCQSGLSFPSNPSVSSVGVATDGTQLSCSTVDKNNMQSKAYKLMKNMWCFFISVHEFLPVYPISQKQTPEMQSPCPPQWFGQGSERYTPSRAKGGASLCTLLSWNQRNLVLLGELGE